jgi:hypothetical protein
MILGADCQDCKENGKPTSCYWLGSSASLGCIPRSILEINHKTGFELIDINNEAPEGLRNLLVSTEKPIRYEISMRISYVKECDLINAMTYFMTSLSDGNSVAISRASR